MRDIEELMRATDPARDVVVDATAVPSPKPRPARHGWRPEGPVIAFAIGVLSIAAIIGGIIVVIPQASMVGEGDYPYYSSAAELEDAASVIVRGTATGEHNASFEGFDYRVVTVSVSAVAKGAPASTIEVKLMSGNTAEGDSNLQVGHEYVLFLETYDEVPASTLNPAQGAYEVVDEKPQQREDNTVSLSPRVLAALGLD